MISLNEISKGNSSESLLFQRGPIDNRFDIFGTHTHLDKIQDPLKPLSFLQHIMI